MLGQSTRGSPSPRHSPRRSTTARPTTRWKRDTRPEHVEGSFAAVSYVQTSGAQPPFGQAKNWSLSRSRINTLRCARDNSISSRDGTAPLSPWREQKAPSSSHASSATAIRSRRSLPSTQEHFTVHGMDLTTILPNQAHNSCVIALQFRVVAVQLLVVAFKIPLFFFGPTQQECGRTNAIPTCCIFGLQHRLVAMCRLRQDPAAPPPALNHGTGREYTFIT